MDSTTKLEAVTPQRFYQYVDNDISTVIDVSLREKGITYLTLPKPDRNNPGSLIDAPTVVLCKDGTAGKEFVPNPLGGINLLLSPLNISDKKDVATYMQEPLEQIRGIMVGKSQDEIQKLFPAQILFPLNLGGAHWVSGQIMIDRAEDGSYGVQFSLYDPMSAIPRPITDRKIVGPFLELFPQIFGGNRPSIAQIINIDNFHVGRKTPSGEVVKMQMGGLACGIFATEGLLGLIDREPQNMWDHFAYDVANASVEESFKNDGAMLQRQRHIELVEKHQDHITQKSRDNFGRDQTRFARFNREDIVVKSCQTRFAQLLGRGFLDALTPQQKQTTMAELWDAVDDVQQLAKAGIKSWERVFGDEELLKLLSAETASGEGEEIVLEIMLENLSSVQIQNILNKPALGAEKKNKIIAKLATVLDVSRTVSAAPTIGASSPVASDPSVDKVVSLFEKVHKKQMAKIDDDINNGIFDANAFAQKHHADRDLLGVALQKYISVEGDIDEQIYGVIALLSAGAAVSQETYDLCVKGENIDDLEGSIRVLLMNEYCLQLVKSKALSELEKQIGVESLFEYSSQKNGDCILHAALENEDPKVFARFFNSQNGAKFQNSQNDLGISVLQKAVLEKNEGAIKLLIEKGASTDLASGEKLSEIAKKIGLTAATVSLIEQKELQLQAAAVAAKPELDRQINGVASLINLCQGVLNRKAMNGSQKTLHDAYALQLNAAGIYDKEQLAEIMSHLGGLRQYLEGRKAGVIPSLADYEGSIAEVITICAANDNEKASKLAQFAIDRAVVEKIEELEDDSIAPAGSGYSTVANYKRPNTLSAAQMKGRAEELFNKRKDAANATIARLDEDLLASLEQRDALKAEPSTPQLKADIAKLEKSIVQKHNLRQSINKRNILSIDKSDFFDSGYLRENGGGVPPILITPDEFSLQKKVVQVKIAESDVVGDIMASHDYVEVNGSLSSIVAVGTEKKFQPYYANFGGMYFKEEPDGTPDKKFIFGEATMFMANFSRGKNEFGQNGCTFENVDFRHMGGGGEKAAKIFSTMNIDGCVFVNCKFPEGIKINQGGEIEFEDDLIHNANSIRDQFATIDNNPAMSDSKKNQAKAAAFNNLLEYKISQHNDKYPTPEDKSAARVARSMERIKGYVSPGTIVHPIAHKCVVIEAAKISAPVHIAL